MNLSATHDYQQDLDSLLQYFSEEDLIIEKYQALGAKNVKVQELKETSAGFVVTTYRDVPANVPSLLKSVLGDYNTIKQVENWAWQDDGSLVCAMSVTIEGVPAEMTGTLHFSEPLNTVGDGPVTRNEINLTITSAIPFVGKQLVNFIGQDSKQQMEAEYQFLKELELTA
ncbi:TPA: DUF2505 domain-containing protein [Photobacterium damselae]|uniref:DUF2505 domain-containing protein n=1 Tax=Photobacterium damselae TaxID=38293 RepID=UPI00109BD0BA|nr:DUF2505 domain-containing protein [Photobacterium damselae]ELV7517199.1 DUF2505 domain-containing protein [Photobacterium damselae]TGZ34419.1 hypothetical protein EQ875_02148 [Photobacterium damselae subsp. damselae]UKA24149.1 DUF2505 domain-containing protein [Photobacterium damselae subsp. damselae]WIH18217.1 DUF2505 domain-containing protein [Photobacterium damselae]